MRTGYGDKGSQQNCLIISANNSNIFQITVSQSKFK